MRFEKILIAAFLLIGILMIGAVSASDGNVTADELTDCEDPVVDDCLMQPQTDDDLGEKQNGTIDFSVDEKMYLGEDMEATFSCDDGMSGKYQFFIDGIMYGEKDHDGSCDGEINVLNENLSNIGLGIHGWELKYSGNGNFNPACLNGTFDYVFLDMTFPDYVHSAEYGVTVFVPDNNPGNITFYINDSMISEIECGDSRDFYDITIPAFTQFANYTWKVVHSLRPEHVYSGTFENTYIDVLSDGISAADPELCIHLPDDITGNVEIYINNQLVKEVAAEDWLWLEIEGFAPGNKTLTVKYPGNKKYPARSYNKVIYFAPRIMVDSYDVEFGGSVEISLVMFEDAKGTLVVKLNDEILGESNFTDGKAVVTISNLTRCGELTAFYSGDDYEVDEESGEINMIPRVTFHLTEAKPYISVEFPSDATGKLDCSVWGDYDDRSFKVSLKNGTANIDLSSLQPGQDCHVELSYEGNLPDFYEEYEIQLPRKAASVTASVPTSVVPGKEYSFKFTLPEKLSGTLKIVNVDGAGGDVTYYSYYKFRTTEDTFADTKSVTVPLYFWKAGTFRLKFCFSFDEMYADAEYDSTVRVSVGCSRIDVIVGTVNYGEDEKIKIKILDINGKPLSNTLVWERPRDLGVWYNSEKTNRNGYVSIILGFDGPGTYKLNMFVAGFYKTITIKIKHMLSLKTVKVKKSAKKLVLTAKLAKRNGKYLKNKEIRFKFNGKAYYRYTDKKGVAKLKIGKKVLKKLKAGKKIKYEARYFDLKYRNFLQDYTDDVPVMSKVDRYIAYKLLSDAVVKTAKVRR